MERPTSGTPKPNPRISARHPRGLARGFFRGAGRPDRPGGVSRGDDSPVSPTTHDGIRPGASHSGTRREGLHPMTVLRLFRPSWLLGASMALGLTLPQGDDGPPPRPPRPPGLAVGAAADDGPRDDDRPGAAGPGGAASARRRRGPGRAAPAPAASPIRPAPPADGGRLSSDRDRDGTALSRRDRRRHQGDEARSTRTATAPSPPTAPSFAPARPPDRPLATIAVRDPAAAPAPAADPTTTPPPARARGTEAYPLPVLRPGLPSFPPLPRGNASPRGAG